MALTPNATTKMNGVIVHEKIIPDGTKWKDATKAKAAGCSAGTRYKREEKLSGNTGNVKFVTVHNTNDLAKVNDDAEQYTRATYNENMGLSRVHYYVDDVGAWQNLKAGTGLFSADPNGSAEVSWHAGDGSVSDGGNMTSLSLEIIMNDTTAHDKKAYDNGARIAAWLLWKHKLAIDKLVTHTYWVNKSAGKTFSDVDKQCTNLIKGKKWCPTYIFGSTDQTKALANWKAFKFLVKKYLDELNGEKAEPTNKGESTVNIELTVLRKGSEGEEVKTLQRLLLALGYEMKSASGKKYGADGDFGGATETAVITFQKAKGLDDDGIVGKKTWEALLKG